MTDIPVEIASYLTDVAKALEGYEVRSLFSISAAAQITEVRFGLDGEDLDLKIVVDDDGTFTIVDME